MSLTSCRTAPPHLATILPCSAQGKMLRAARYPGATGMSLPPGVLVPTNPEGPPDKLLFPRSLTLASVSGFACLSYSTPPHA